MSTNKGQFKKSHKPWNKNLKGIHLSPSSEFKKGSIPINKCPIGTRKIRHHMRGKIRDSVWIKIAEPKVWVLLCRYIWEQHYGPIPKGLLIHHIDEDNLNNALINLALVSKAYHLQIHRPEFEEKRSKAATEARWGKNSTNQKSLKN